MTGEPIISTVESANGVPVLAPIGGGRRPRNWSVIAVERRLKGSGEPEPSGPLPHPEIAALSLGAIGDGEQDVMQLCASYSRLITPPF